MSTVRITAAKGDVEVPARGTATGRAPDAADAEGGFAAALGALVAPTGASTLHGLAGLGNRNGAGDGGSPSAAADPAAGDAAGNPGAGLREIATPPPSSLPGLDGGDAATAVPGVPGDRMIGSGSDDTVQPARGKAGSDHQRSTAQETEASKATAEAVLAGAVTIAAAPPAPAAAAPNTGAAATSAADGSASGGAVTIVAVLLAPPPPPLPSKTGTDAASAAIGTSRVDTAPVATAHPVTTGSLPLAGGSPAATPPVSAPATPAAAVQAAGAPVLVGHVTASARDDAGRPPAPPVRITVQPHPVVATTPRTADLSASTPPALGAVDVDLSSVAAAAGLAAAKMPDRVPALPMPGAVTPSQSQSTMPTPAMPVTGAMLAGTIAAGAASATDMPLGDRRRDASTVAAGQAIDGNPSPPDADPAIGGALPGSPPADVGAGVTTTADLADRLSDQIIRLLANSDRSAVVRLHPPDLGEVTVRVALEGRDVTAWFAAPQPLVQQTISQGIGLLQSHLGSAGYNLSGAWVGADASGSGAGGGNVPLPPVPRALPAAANFAPSGVVPTAPRSGSGVSIYV